MALVHGGKEYYKVGTMVNTHGLKGEMKVMPQTDFPEVRFAKEAELYLFPAGTATPVKLTVAEARLQKNMYIIRFDKMNHINDVERYKGLDLHVSEEQEVELEDDEFFYHEIMGCKVVTEEGEELGEITEILSPGANDVWVITRPDRSTVLIPYIDDVVLEVDVEEKRVKIHLMEGLI